MLYHEIAEKFITRLTAYTKYNINIMDDKGVIIASRNPERVGTFHEAAFDIVKNKREIIEVSQEDRMLGTRPGVNLPLLHQNRVIGVIGVTGDPEEVHPIALIVKMSMETMLDYEYQREQSTKRQSQKEHFVYRLIRGDSTDSAQLEKQAEALGYSEEPMRIPILIHLEGTAVEPQEILDRIKAEVLHTSQDISLVTREGEILIYKCLPESKDVFSDYKYLIGEYLHPFMMRAGEKNLIYRFYIGSIQDRFNYYASAYEHCRWLEREQPGKARGLFFYDYVDAYLKGLIPEIEYHRIFNCMKKRLRAKERDRYIETVGSLKRNNYNMAASSKELFVHKNTLTFRFDKIRNQFNMNPVRSTRDREFMEYLLYYLDENH